jgi:hypothetical protein
MIDRQATHLGVIRKVAGLGRAFARHTLQGSLGHESLHSGMKKGRGHVASSLAVGRR